METNFLCKKQKEEKNGYNTLLHLRTTRISNEVVLATCWQLRTCNHFIHTCNKSCAFANFNMDSKEFNING